MLLVAAVLKITFVDVKFPTSPRAAAKCVDDC
jgi:hypothetical protein